MTSTIVASYSLANPHEPWSVSEKAPIIKQDFVTSDPEKSFWEQNFDYGFYFYQKIVSPADGARCQMYPTCTHFGYQAIKEHGPIIGTWMATDRFMRDHGKNLAQYPPIAVYGYTRYYDPIDENDFWFN